MNEHQAKIDESLWPALRWLGYGGWAPFAVLLLSAWQLGGLWTQALLIYAVAIVSFVGALSWGWALALPDLSADMRRRLLAWSVVPCLLACAAALLPSPTQWVGLSAVYALAWFMDWRHNAALAWPQEWLRLRLQLSLGAIASLLLAATWGL